MEDQSRQPTSGHASLRKIPSTWNVALITLVLLFMLGSATYRVIVPLRDHPIIGAILFAVLAVVLFITVRTIWNAGTMRIWEPSSTQFETLFPAESAGEAVGMAQILRSGLVPQLKLQGAILAAVGAASGAYGANTIATIAMSAAAFVLTWLLMGTWLQG